MTALSATAFAIAVFFVGIAVGIGVGLSAPDGARIGAGIVVLLAGAGVFAFYGLTSL